VTRVGAPRSDWRHFLGQAAWLAILRVSLGWLWRKILMVDLCPKCLQSLVLVIIYALRYDMRDFIRKFSFGGALKNWTVLHECMGRLNCRVKPWRPRADICGMPKFEQKIVQSMCFWCFDLEKTTSLVDLNHFWAKSENIFWSGVTWKDDGSLWSCEKSGLFQNKGG